MTNSVLKACNNCSTSDTPLWRKIENGIYCNACALFHKTHGKHRIANSGDGNGNGNANANSGHTEEEQTKIINALVSDQGSNEQAEQTLDTENSN